MRRPLLVRLIASATMLGVASACGTSTDAPAAPPRVTVTRPAGSWEGSGSRTLGFMSESGRFRVTWEARDEHPPAKGSFRLTVHSAVSGRPIQLIADQQGAGHGTTQVEDDPRPYNLMIESDNVAWSVAVEEVLVTGAPPAAGR